jgi:negative regulator of flagellin synthesis FlgM
MSQVLKKYNKTQQRKQNNKTDNISKNDKLSLSKEALELQKIKKDVQEVSKARREKIARLKKEVKQGNYHVSGEDIAEKMLNQTMIDKLI